MVMEASNTTRPLGVASSERFRAYAKGLIPRALAIRRLRRSQTPTVLLTFDDGPHPDVTPAVLDRLAAYDARAVFFLVGRRVRRAGAIVDRIHKAGHSIGNHTHLHRSAYVEDVSFSRLVPYYRDCRWCQRSIEDAAGVRPTLFRPPGGRLTPASMLVPKILGLRCVTWSLHVDDWAFRTVDEAHAGAAELLGRVTPGDIVLLHDNNPRQLDLLDLLLPGLKSHGYDLARGVDLL
jgi:peptidoglycan/xylan/chitin deacetylase (PgdA/CDA1 family)